MGSATKRWGKKDHGLKCDTCELWHHTSCEGVGEHLYKAIQDAETDKTQGLHWYCKKCNRFASGFMAGLKRLSARQDALEEKVSDFEAQVSKKFKEVEVSHEELVLKLQSVELETGNNASVSVEQAIKEAQGASVEQAIREVQDRQERKLNVIFFNIDESSAEDPKQAKSDDLEKVRGVLEQVGINVPIANPTRLGKKMSSARPLRIKTANEKDVISILGIGKKLKRV